MFEHDLPYTVSRWRAWCTKAKIVPFTKVVWLLIQLTHINQHKPANVWTSVRILLLIMLAQNTTWISLLLFLETTSPYKHDGSLRFCVPFQFETHGRYHSNSMLTVFLKLLFRQYILWCDGYQVSYLIFLRMFVLYPVWSLLATLYAFLLWGLSSLWLFIHLSLSYGLYSRSCSYCRLLLLYRKWC